MNLLLLLSALLSALTGVVGGVQRIEASPAVERCFEASARPAASAAVTWRPAVSAVTLRAVASAVVPVHLPSASIIPLWANRRRE